VLHRNHRSRYESTRRAVTKLAAEGVVETTMVHTYIERATGDPLLLWVRLPVSVVSPAPR
jgi:hypothetical protein